MLVLSPQKEIPTTAHRARSSRIAISILAVNGRLLSCAAANALFLAGTLAGAALAAPAGHEANAHIAGRVLVCNTPDHCPTRTFRVSAIDAQGHVVARSTTFGRFNRYRLEVPAGSYALLAVSHGLHCNGSADVSAHRTVTADITCLVP